MDEYASRLIRFKARQLARRRAFAGCEADDIAQDLWLDLHKRLPRYDPARAQLNTFIARIVERKVVSLLRYHGAAKRTRDREDCSLNDQVRDADGRPVDRHQVMPEASSTWQRLHDLERDVADIRQRLESETLGEIVDALGRGQPVSAIAREHGVSRTTVERRIAEIREVFEDAGLRRYL